MTGTRQGDVHEFALRETEPPLRWPSSSFVPNSVANSDSALLPKLHQVLPHQILLVRRRRSWVYGVQGKARVTYIWYITIEQNFNALRFMLIRFKRHFHLKNKLINHRNKRLQAKHVFLPSPIKIKVNESASLV